MKLQGTCNQSLTKYIDNDDQLMKMMDKYEGSLKKKVTACLYKYNPKL